ncbi:MAG: hypothetical protein IPM15_03060 [Betaproteobacteria bacterium]|nr:hypothetical protein [Betaproteobacteria bacterium]MCC6249968.1 hypothetical protein [Rubrivivax sp.]MCL4696617.1 hypothetical protein [Burkholderiaceae bacterium]
MHRRLTPRRAAAFVFLLAMGAAAPLSAQQSQPATPPARPAAAAPTPAAPAAPAASARGFGSARGPILTRDELRVCFGQEDELKKRIGAQDAARGPLEQEKKAIGDEQVALKAERAKLEGGGELSAGVAAFSERNKAFTERRVRWEARVKAYNDAGRDAREEERDALNAESLALKKEQEALEAERKRLLALQDGNKDVIAAHNAKARALDARIVEWNKRQKAHLEVQDTIEADRLAWMSNCGNRRYREEDELAIRPAGK